MIKYILLFSSLFLIIACSEKKKQADSSTKKEVRDTNFEALYQYYHSEPLTLEQKEENRIIDYVADQKMEIVRTRSGIYIANHQPGAGDSIKWGDPITVHYNGFLMDGQMFDSSIKRGKPISFRVGSMIAGWNEALPFLKVGSKAKFFIPSHMGYGKRGFEGFLGPDEILIFDIEILEKRNQN